jgi:hypothetical protein
MYEEIEALDADTILREKLDELAVQIAARHRIEVPRLGEQHEWSALHEDTQVKVNLGAGYALVPGLRTTIYIPFEGYPWVFNLRPHTSDPSGSPYIYDFSSASDELMLVIESRYSESEGYNYEFAGEQLKQTLSEICRYLSWVSQEIEPYNASLPDWAHTRLETRRRKFLGDQSFAEGLGIALRRRKDAPKTHEIPLVRKSTPVASLPDASASRADLPDKIYDHILSVISSMVRVMELSPKAFAEMGEEDLRSHFLVQLNGQYEGNASGETFNYGGKTDILVKWEGENVFVAECKIWRGEESLKKALDQLFGYASWRDTKTALLLFNRRRSFSSVLKKIPEVIKEHESFERVLPSEQSEGQFRFLMRRPDDPDRSLTLTVLAFNIPHI